MSKEYLKETLTEEDINFIEDGDDLIIDSSGNPSQFLAVFKLLNDKMETWTYECLLNLNIQIDTSYEKIIISIK